MKAAIVTIQSENNGNRLQNYALQTVLFGMGYDVESIRREPCDIVKNAKRALRNLLKNDSLARFAEFDRANIAFSNNMLSQRCVSTGFAEAYDAYVIGSDQVWNPHFGMNSDLDYLPMVEPSKKVAYAASFGVREIRSNRAHTAELLNGIPFLSVREEAGANIIKGLTGRDVPVVLDPTMLLTPDEWARVAKKPRTFDCSEPFVFKCVIGNDVNGAAIDRLAQNRGLKVVDVADTASGVGPAEFVWLVSHCDLVCTDSFHASVFAALHHRPLAIFERDSANEDMSSRFDTLCKTFGFEAHRFSNIGFGDEAVFGTDWDAFERCLEELRLFSRGWLESAIGGVTRG